MFSHRLNNTLFKVEFSDYAERHFLRSFRKKYKGNIWLITERSIIFDLERIANNLQFTQQVDELKMVDGKILFKYDFAVAKSGKSPKTSGNRCVCLLDINKNMIEILAIYSKDNLPKNMSETAFIEQLL